MEPPKEMLRRAEQMSVVLHQMVPPGVFFMVVLATEGENGWVILRGNIADEGLREAVKELAARL